MFRRLQGQFIDAPPIFVKEKVVTQGHIKNLGNKLRVITMEEEHSTVLLQIHACKLKDRLHVPGFTHIPRRNGVRISRIRHRWNRKVLQDIGNDQIDTSVPLFLVETGSNPFAVMPNLNAKEIQSKSFT